MVRCKGVGLGLKGLGLGLLHGEVQRGRAGRVRARAATW